MLGYLHHFVSRSFYNQQKVILARRGVHLPDWKTLQRTRSDLKKLVNFRIVESISVWGNKLFTISLKTILANVSNSLALVPMLIAYINTRKFLQELGNSYVINNLEFFPHQSEGAIVDSLCQSFKWREGLPRQYRVQMVVANEKHFYIYEPVQLVTGKVVVPLFFYKCKNEVLSKCIIPHFLDKKGSKGTFMCIPSNLKI
jgi:hypothetical protein